MRFHLTWFLLKSPLSFITLSEADPERAEHPLGYNYSDEVLLGGH